MTDVGGEARGAVLDHAAHAYAWRDLLVVEEAGCAIFLLATRETARDVAQLALFCGVEGVCGGTFLTNIGVSATLLAIRHRTHSNISYHNVSISSCGESVSL